MIMATHPIFGDPGATDDWWSQGGHLRSNEVKWGQNPVFANNSLQDGDRDAQMVPNDLARQTASEYMHIDRLRSWPEFGLTWPGSNFEIVLSRSKSTCFEPAWRAKNDGIIFIIVSLISKNLSMKNHLHEKQYFSFNDIWSQNCWP